MKEYNDWDVVVTVFDEVFYKHECNDEIKRGATKSEAKEYAKEYKEHQEEYSQNEMDMYYHELKD